MQLSSIYYPAPILEGVNYLANQLEEGTAPRIGSGRSSNPYGTVQIMLLTLMSQGAIDNPEDVETLRRVVRFITKNASYYEETGRVRIYGDASTLGGFLGSGRFELATYED